MRRGLIVGLLILSGCGALKKKGDADKDAEPSPTPAGEEAEDPKPAKPVDPACAIEAHDQGLAAISARFVDTAKSLTCAEAADCVLVTPPCFGSCQVPASRLSGYPDFVAHPDTKAYCADLQDRGCTAKTSAPKICLEATQIQCVEGLCIGSDDSQQVDECALLQARMRAAFPVADARHDPADTACEQDGDCRLVTGPNDVLCSYDASFVVNTTYRQETFDSELAALATKLKATCEQSFDPVEDCAERTGSPLARCHLTQKICTTVWK